MSFTNPFEKPQEIETPATQDFINQEAPQRSETALPFTPKRFTPPKRKDDSDETYLALLEDDEESIILNQKKATLTDYRNKDDDQVLVELEKSIDKLKKEHITGGIKRVRIITADILLSAPRGWFNKYATDAKIATSVTQTELSEQNRTDAIGKAQAQPTDEALQDDAFRAIQGVLSDYLDTKNYRGAEKYLMYALVTNEILGFSVLDPLWRDRRIDEIIVNGPKDVQVEIRGQLYRVPACEFRDEEHLMNLIERLYGAINKTVTRMTPLVDGRLHDQSRMVAVHSSVAPDGPNFVVRRHPEKYWTPNDLIENGSMSQEIAEVLGNLVYKGASFMVIGGTGTGKTSFLNAMTGFYRNNVRLVTLEDNLEMKPAPHKMLAAAMECVEPRADSKSKGVNMRELVKVSLRMRPDGIIIGEVRDGAAFDLCQALTTGHFGASTVHANNEQAGIYRMASLISQGELVTADEALPTIAQAFDFIVFLKRFPVDGSRRVVSISEVDSSISVDKSGRVRLGVNKLWGFVDDGIEDGKIIGHWEKYGEVSEQRRENRGLNLEEDLTWDELEAIAKIPEEYLKKNNSH